MRRFFALLVLLAVLIPVSGWGATYTVCSSGCNYTTIGGAFAGVDLAPGDVVEVRADTPGGSKTYTESVTWGSNDFGTAGNPVTLKARAGDSITVDGGANAHALYITTLSYLRIEDMRFIGGATYGIRINGICTNIHLERVTAEDSAAPVYIQGAVDAITANRCLFRNSTVQPVFTIASVTAPAVVTLNNCVLENGKTRLLSAAGTGLYTLTARNCTMSGCFGDGVINTGAGAVVLTNSTVNNANMSDSASYHALKNTSTGSITYSNSSVQPDWKNLAYSTTGVTDGGNNLVRTPQFIGVRRGAVVGFMIDDSVNVADWSTLAQWAMSTHGIGVDITAGTALVSEGDWAIIQARVAEGHGFVPHGRREAVVTDLNGLRIYYTGAATTATVTVSGGVLTTHLDSVLDKSISLAGKSLNTVAAEINGGDYVSTVHNTYGTPGAYNLADITTINIKVSAPGYAAVLSQSRLFEDEIVQSKVDLAARGMIATTYVYPTGANNSAAHSALLAAGYFGARAILAGNFMQDTGVNIYNLRAWGLHNNIGTSNIERSIESILDMAAFTGGYVQFYSHDFASASGTGYSFDNWKTVINTVAAYISKNPTVVHMNQDEAVAFIRANSTTSDNITYTRTFTTNNADYRPLPTSPLIGAGAIITGVHDQTPPATDFNGDIVHFQPNIGPYDGRKQLSVTSNFTPTGYTVRGTDTEPAILSVDADGVVVTLSGLTNNEAVQVKSRKEFSLITDKSKHTVKPAGGGGSSGGGFGFGW